MRHVHARPLQVDHGVRAQGGVQTRYSAANVWLTLLHSVVLVLDAAVGAALATSTVQSNGADDQKGVEPAIIVRTCAPLSVHTASSHSPLSH